MKIEVTEKELDAIVICLICRAAQLDRVSPIGVSATQLAETAEWLTALAKRLGKIPSHEHD